MVFVMIPEDIIPYLNSCFVQGSIGQDGKRGADGRTGFCVSIFIYGIILKVPFYSTSV